MEVELARCFCFAAVAQMVEHHHGKVGVIGSIPISGSRMKMFPNGYKDLIENVVGLVLVLAAIAAAFYFFDFEAVQQAVERAGAWAPLFLIAAKASTLVFAPLSGAAIYPLAGAVFGFAEGALYLMIGDLIGSIVSFYISRLFGRRVVERFARGNVPLIDKVLAFMETTKGFLVARICFIALPEAVTYAAGLTRIRFIKFILISTAVGAIPTLILSAAGAWFAMGEGMVTAILLSILGLAVAVFGALYFFNMTNKHAEAKVIENAESK